MTCQGLSGDIRDHKGLKGVIRDYQGLSGVVRGCRGLSGVVRDFPGVFMVKGSGCTCKGSWAKVQYAPVRDQNP